MNEFEGQSITLKTGQKYLFHIDEATQTNQIFIFKHVDLMSDEHGLSMAFVFRKPNGFLVFLKPEDIMRYNLFEVV